MKYNLIQSRLAKFLTLIFLFGLFVMFTNSNYLVAEVKQATVTLSVSDIRKEERTATINFSISASDAITQYKVTFSTPPGVSYGKENPLLVYNLSGTNTVETNNISASFPSNGVYSIKATVEAANAIIDNTYVGSSTIEIDLSYPATTTTAAPTTTTAAPTTTTPAATTNEATTYEATTITTTTKPTATLSPTPRPTTTGTTARPTTTRATTTESTYRPFTPMEGKFITTTRIDARSGPGLSYDYLGDFEGGTVIDVFGLTDNGWYVTMFNGTEAYVPGSYLRAYTGQATSATTTRSNATTTTAASTTLATTAEATTEATVPGETTSEETTGLTSEVTTEVTTTAVAAAATTSWNGLTVPGPQASESVGGTVNVGGMKIDIPFVILILFGVLLAATVLAVVLRKRDDRAADEPYEDDSTPPAPPAAE